MNEARLMLAANKNREGVTAFLLSLRETIIHAFEDLEKQQRFERKKWDYQHSGGGEIAVIRGTIFEKAAVNWSGVAGPKFPLGDKEEPFFATGISLITHMVNPHAPTVHFNLRYMETPEKQWFGGGYDLNPMGITYQEDVDHFHGIAKKTLDPFHENYYPQMSEEARKYFYIPHRKKERGVGGIFFDHWNTGDFDKDFDLWKSVGLSFLESVLPIYKKRITQSYTDEEKNLQLHARAHYAEFNLVYDRGTKFGFQSGGNPEAILCSMPPLVKW